MYSTKIEYFFQGTKEKTTHFHPYPTRYTYSLIRNSSSHNYYFKNIPYLCSTIGTLVLWQEKRQSKTTSMSKYPLLTIILYLFVLLVPNAVWAASDIFSSSTTEDSLIPVQLSNHNSKGYAISMNPAIDYSGQPINSGHCGYQENEIWYLVGTAESFMMYNHVAGMSLALTLGGDNQGAAATLTPMGTPLCLTPHPDGSYAISPKSNPTQSLNMYGGTGQNIKLYDAADRGSRWHLRRIDMSKALTINYKGRLKGGYEQNYKIGELSITIAGTTSTIMLDKHTLPKSTTCYLPEDAEFSIGTGLICHGWTMNIDGKESLVPQTLPVEGTTVNVNIAVDKSNKYQYLYYSPSNEGKPYRIPAITTTANGYVFAINDYRPCGNDIGFGEVDLVMRHSVAPGRKWDGHTWTDEIKIADGIGAIAHTQGETWKVGFGDPAIVADRENNEILVMSVCGNRLCWHGNYGAGTEETPENPNRVSRIRIKFDKKSRQWIVGQPEEVTYDIYPLFKDSEGNAHVGSLFIGAGRIAQSSQIKVGTHYRIYCAVWAVSTGSSRYHNYAIYSDDFGESWNLLGELGRDFNDSPAPYGNEPKCEELPDGSVLLSSRKGYGRYFNVFRYTDIERGEGTWDGVVSTDQVGDLKWGSNDTNGEPLRIGNVLFQSAPTGYSNPANEARSDVAVFYKVLSDNPISYTPTELSNGWTKIPISDRNSAYSSMTILPDGNIGLFYEEAPGWYSMVYVPLDLKKLLPRNVYKELR